jgi:hypothetical protein
VAYQLHMHTNTRGKSPRQRVGTVVDRFRKLFLISFIFVSFIGPSARAGIVRSVRVVYPQGVFIEVRDYGLFGNYIVLARRPVVTRPVVTRPIVTRPVVTRPVVTRPVVGRPFVMGRPPVPVVARPVVRTRVAPARRTRVATRGRLKPKTTTSASPTIQASNATKPINRLGHQGGATLAQSGRAVDDSNHNSTISVDFLGPDKEYKSFSVDSKNLAEQERTQGWDSLVNRVRAQEKLDGSKVVRGSIVNYTNENDKWWIQRAHDLKMREVVIEPRVKKDATVKEVADIVGPACQFANSRGITLSLRNNNSSVVMSDMASISQVLDLAARKYGCNNLGIALDTSKLDYSPGLAAKQSKKYLKSVTIDTSVDRPYWSNYAIRYKRTHVNYVNDLLPVLADMKFKGDVVTHKGNSQKTS